MAETVTCLFGPAKELVKCIAPALYPAITEQYGYLCCFNSNIESLRNEAQQLENARARVQRQLYEDENNARRINPEVKEWLTKTDQIHARKEGIETKIPNVQSTRLNFISRYSLSKEARLTTAAMKELRDQSHEFQTVCHPACPAAQVPILLGPLQEFQSRKQIEEDVMKALRDKTVNILGIGGMGGVGKTTMAEKVGRKVRGENLFNDIVIAVVSQHVNISEIQREIADQLGLDLQNVKSVKARACKLHERLKDRKSLIILDDIWNQLGIEDLGISRESGFMECVVLLTSRSVEVLNQMNAEVFTMKILSDDEAWSLIREKAGTCVEDPDLISIAKQVAIECKGLPLALITVGGALNNKEDGRIWRDALHQLKGSHLKNIPYVLNDVYCPLKLSYEFIDNEEAKFLFLLCCLFPEDYDISLEDLTLYCWSLDLFEGISSLEQATNRIFSLVDMLKRRFLLLDGRSMTVDGRSKQHVKMHDVVRDVAIEIASEEGRANVNLRSMGHSCSDYEWISIIVPNASSVYPDDLMRFNFPNLHLLAIHQTGLDTREINDFSFLDGMKALNVLSFTRTSFKLLPEISMQSWKNLRTLIFERCWLEDLSFVGNLLSLEILKCTRCYKIEELPDEMRRLKRLKLLEVSHCRSLKRIAPGVISELVELEELKMLGSFDGWESANINEEERKNASLKEVESLPKLTCLQIQIKDVSLLGEDIRLSSKIEEYDIRLSSKIEEYEIRVGSLLRLNPRTLEKVIARSGLGYFPQTHAKVMALYDLPREINLGSWIHKLARTAEGLCLSGDGSYSLDLSQVQKHIKSLEIRDSETKKNLMIKSDIICDLESLCLQNLPNLEELCDGPILDGNGSHLIFPKLGELTLSNLPSLTTFGEGVESIEFPVLSEMEIKDCPKLRRLPSSVRSHQNAGGCNNEGGFPQLGLLNISNCKMMEEVFSVEENNINDANGSHLIFPKLRALTLRNLPSLTTFGKGVESIEFPFPSQIHIEDCPKLRRLPSSVRSHQNAGGYNNDEGGFPQLDKLRIWNCEMMEEVFSIEENSINDANGSHLIFPKLEQLLLDNLPSLTTFGKGVESIEFPVLSQMHIQDCPKLRRLASSVRSHQNPGGCNNDEDCPHLFCKPKGGFSQLKSLTIQNCEMMEEVFSIEENSINDANGSHLIFPKLKELWLCNLPSLTTFGKGVESIEFPVLYSMRIEDCPKLRRLASSVRSHQNAGGCNNDEDCPHLFCNPKVTFSMLIDLKISGYNDIRRLFSPSTTIDFLNLQRLEISSCKKMEEILLYEENGTNGNVSSITFPNLGELELIDMPNLRTFYKGIDSIEFPELNRMAIRGCSELVSFVSSNGSNQDLEDGHEDDYFHLFCSEKVAFCGLKDLEIGGYGNITNMWCHKIPHGFFRILEKLKIHDCGNIKILFSHSIAENLVNLKNLSIKSCKQMEIVNGGVEKIYEKSPLFPSLERLRLEDLSKLRSLCEWEWNLELPLLTEISISNCPKMEFLTPGSLSAPNLEGTEVDNEWIDRKELNEMVDLNDVLRQQMSKGMEATPSTPTDKDENEGQGTAKKSNIEDEEN